MRIFSARVAIVLGILALLLGILGLPLGSRIFTNPVGTFNWLVYSAGHKALFGCSGVFVAGRTPEGIMDWEIRYASPIFNAPGWISVDRDSRTVTGKTFYGLISRQALYREGFGCALVPPDGGAEAMTEMPVLDSATGAVDRDKVPWPDGDFVPQQQLPPEVDEDILARVVEQIFDGHTYFSPDLAWMPDAKTTGLVVVYRGKIVAEKYAPGWDAHTQVRTYSTAKSFTNAMTGARVLEGKLDITRPVAFEQWTDPDDPRRAITLENYLHMSSGLKCDGGAGDSLNTYFAGGNNAAMDAINRPLEHPPGTHWCYANFDSISVALAVGRTFPSQAEWLAYPRRALLDKIGMRDTVMETDAYGNFIMSSQIWTTPRDLARFGLLYINDGVWNGERILPEGWVEFTRTPAPSTQNVDIGRAQGYGAQFWLLQQAEERLPDDTFSSRGHGGQFSTIIPSRDLVIARMGIQNLDWERAVADLLSAFP